MWKLLGLTLIFQFNNLIQGKLIGDHVCMSEESYLANITEYHTRNATARNYQWCMNIPPRCSFYTTRTINESKIVERNITRTLEKCCEGFIERDDRCISECDRCINGMCERGKCLCFAGYSGHFCEVGCATGTWGNNCSLACDCADKKCNPVNGSCSTQDITTTEIDKTSTITTNNEDDTSTQHAIPEKNAFQNQILDNTNGVSYTEYRTTQRNIDTTATRSMTNKMFSTVHPNLLKSEHRHSSTTETTVLKSTTDAFPFSLRNDTTNTSNFPSSISPSQPTSSFPNIVTYGKTYSSDIYNNNDLPISQLSSKPSVTTYATKSSNLSEETTTKSNLSTTTLLPMLPIINELPLTTGLYSKSREPSSVTSAKTQEQQSSDDKPTKYNFFGTTTLSNVLPNEQQSISETPINAVTSTNSPNVESIHTWTKSSYSSGLTNNNYSNRKIPLKATEILLSSLRPHIAENEFKESLIPVEVHYDQINRPMVKKDALTTTPNNFADEKTFLTVENQEYNNNKHISEENSEIAVNYYSIAGSTVIIVVVVMILLFIGISNWRQKSIEKDDRTNTYTHPAFSVYTTSIFHTPLPDPPTFDNPTYLTPAELRIIPSEQISFKSNVINATKVDTTLREIKDYREFVYDHPPSTGSYRAASSIEPLESNLNQRLSEIEPVYDEIPQRSLDIAETSLSYNLDGRNPTSIYINTCARTKF